MLLLAGTLAAETFVLPANLSDFASESSALPACRTFGADGRRGVGRCPPGATARDLVHALEMEVSCASDRVRFSMPSWLRVDPEGLVEFISGRSIERVNVRVAHQLRDQGVEMLDVRLANPMDIAIGAGGFSAGACGGRATRGTPCSKIGTSGTVRWPRLGGTMYFVMPRSWLWSHLRERQRVSDEHDAGSGAPEPAWVRIAIRPVKNPSVSSRAIGPSSAGRYFQHWQARPDWMLTGKATYKRFPISSLSDRHHAHWPEELRLDLNRLQDIYQACPQLPSAPLSGADPPSQVSAARQAVRRLRASGDWDAHRSQTLERFAAGP